MSPRVRPGTIGDPGVLGAWLEPDSDQARQAILTPLALCSICGNGSGGTAEASKPSPPAMGGGPRSIHRLLDSKAVLRLPPRPFSFGWRVRLLPLSSLCLSRSPSRTPDTGSGFGDRSEGNRGSLPNERLPGLLPLSVLPAGDGNHPLASSCLS